MPFPEYPLQNLESSHPVERFAVRVVLIDTKDSVLLLSREPFGHSESISWELPGGGIEANESIVGAAIREISEETGFLLAPESLSAPLWARDVRYRFHGERRVQHETILAARIGLAAPDINVSGREVSEFSSHQRFHWWTAAELLSASAMFYPRDLPKHFDAILAGRRVHAPVEDWDALT